MQDDELERMLFERFSSLGFNNAPLSSNADVSLTPDVRFDEAWPLARGGSQTQP
jgi:hypothetical protein